MVNVTPTAVFTTEATEDTEDDSRHPTEPPIVVKGQTPIPPTESDPYFACRVRLRYGDWSLTPYPLW